MSHATAAEGPVKPGLTNTNNTEFALERYKYILQQLHSVNENVHKFLGIFQVLTTSLAGGAVAVTLGYKKWGVSPAVAQASVQAVMWLITLVTTFTVMLIIAGMFTWMDYRKEECELLKSHSNQVTRSAPSWGNFWRWYETYVLAFMVSACLLLWLLGSLLLVPAIK